MQELYRFEHSEPGMIHMHLLTLQQNFLMNLTRARCSTAGRGHKNSYWTATNVP